MKLNFSLVLLLNRLWFVAGSSNKWAPPGLQTARDPWRLLLRLPPDGYGPILEVARERLPPPLGPKGS